MIELHKAYSRGKAEHGWLKSRFSFSFANYQNPKRMGFGTLRVLNDDVIAPSMGFDLHEHANYEIITIVLKGTVRHTDSMGNTGVVKAGEVQRISAGRGIAHSEHNASKTEPLELLQIWVKPKERDIDPSYEQKQVTVGKNDFVAVVCGKEESGALGMHQDARFAMAEIEAGTEVAYTPYQSTNGQFVFVISGMVTVANEQLKDRDAAAITDEQFSVKAVEKSTVLIIDVPMM